MSLVSLGNIAKMTTATTGTGTMTLGSAVDGYVSFSTASIADASVVSYTIVDGDEKEVGYGTYTASGTTLTRNLVLSTTGSLLNLSGAATVEVVLAAADIVRSPLAPGFRLSLTSGVAVMTADATAQSTVYAVPYTSPFLPIYNGAKWQQFNSAQMSLALNTSDNLAEKVYDVYAFNNAGTPTLGTGPAWINTATITVTIATPAVVTWTGHGLPEGAPVVFTTSGALPTGITAGTTYYVGRSPAANTFNISTSVANAAAGTFVATSGSQSGTHTGTNNTSLRGTGAGTTELEVKDGIITNKNSITLKAGGSTVGTPAANCATLLGSIYCTANGQTGVALFPSAAAGGGSPVLGVSNAYNRVPMTSISRDSTASWTYNSGTWRGTNGNVGNRVNYLDCLGTAFVTARTSILGEAGNGNYASVGLNRDSTATTPTLYINMGTPSSPVPQFPVNFAFDFLPSAGFHYIQGMEVRNAGAGTVTFYANNYQSIVVRVEA